MAVIFGLLGLLNAARAYQSGDLFQSCFAGLWFLGAMIWGLRFRAERRFRQGL